VIGIFGNLVEGHQSHNVAVANLGSAELAALAAREEGIKRRLTGVEEQLHALDAAATAAGRRGRATQVQQMAEAQKAARQDLEAQLEKISGELEKLAVERAGLDVRKRIANAEDGPLTAIATIIGLKPDETANILSAALAILLHGFSVFFVTVAEKPHTLKEEPPLVYAEVMPANYYPPQQRALPPPEASMVDVTQAPRKRQYPRVNPAEAAALALQAQAMAEKKKRRKARKKRKQVAQAAAAAVPAPKQAQPQKGRAPVPGPQHRPRGFKPRVVE
jgi:hypothetical protein